MSTQNDETSKPISELEFDGLGQGVIDLKVRRVNEDYCLSVKRACDVDETWDFLMRNAADVDIAVAHENFKTLIWRSGVWFVEKWLQLVNRRLYGRKTTRIGQPGWVRYTCHPVSESPFLDPETNSPIAVIDSNFCVELYPDKPMPPNPDWIIEPWAAIFLHDAGCLSCLPELDDRYFFMLDLLPGLVEQAKGLPIDQADFLGRMHDRYEPPVTDFEFLKDWGPTFEK